MTDDPCPAAVEIALILPARSTPAENAGQQRRLPETGRYFQSMTV
jgi:hypothetical protein